MFFSNKFKPNISAIIIKTRKKKSNQNTQKPQIKHTKIQINTDIKTKKAKQSKQNKLKLILSLLIKNHTFKLIPDDGCVN